MDSGTDRTTDRQRQSHFLRLCRSLKWWVLQVYRYRYNFIQISFTYIHPVLYCNKWKITTIMTRNTMYIFLRIELIFRTWIHTHKIRNTPCACQRRNSSKNHTQSSLTETIEFSIKMSQVESQGVIATVTRTSRTLQLRGTCTAATSPINRLFLSCSMSFLQISLPLVLMVVEGL